MVEIEFYDGDRVIKGILLGKYQRPHDRVYAYKKKVLWKTRTIYAHRTLNTPLYVIFIPWRHQLKELREVDEKDIVNSQSLNEDDAWIKKDKFISEIQDDFGYSRLLGMCKKGSWIIDWDCIDSVDQYVEDLHINSTAF